MTSFKYFVSDTHRLCYYENFSNNDYSNYHDANEDYI